MKHIAAMASLLGLCTITTLALSSTGVLVFNGGDARQTTSTGEWAAWSYKSECSGAWLQGLSQSPSTHAAHAAHCETSNAKGGLLPVPGASFAPVDFTNTTTSQNTLTDWDPGFDKAECVLNQGVVGVAQTPQGQVSRILCRPGAPVATADTSTAACFVRVFYWGDSIYATTAEWDYGFYKGECSSDQGYILRGISRDPLAQTPHALLCCG